MFSAIFFDAVAVASNHEGYRTNCDGEYCFAFFWWLSWSHFLFNWCYTYCSFNETEQHITFCWRYLKPYLHWFVFFFKSEKFITRVWLRMKKNQNKNKSNALELQNENGTRGKHLRRMKLKPWKVDITSKTHVMSNVTRPTILKMLTVSPFCAQQMNT